MGAHETNGKTTATEIRKEKIRAELAEKYAVQNAALTGLAANTRLHFTGEKLEERAATMAENVMKQRKEEKWRLGI